MRTIYIDAEFKCHLASDSAMTAVETEAFDGKCDAYVEGHRFVPAGAVWIRADGRAFRGEMIAPWKPWAELEAAQIAADREELERLRGELEDMAGALALLGVTEEVFTNEEMA